MRKKGGVFSIAISIRGNGIRDPSSNPEQGWLHFTLILLEKHESVFSSPSYGKIVKKTKFFSFGKATSQGKGKTLNSNQLHLCHILLMVEGLCKSILWPGVVVLVKVPSMDQIDRFEKMFKIILKYIYTLTLKALILRLSMKCLPV